MSKKQKIMIAVIAAAVILAAVVLIYQNSQAKAELKAVQQGAVQTITEVNLDDYKKADQDKVSALKENYTAQVEKAENPEDVEGIMDKFWDELKKIETKAEKLDNLKEKAKKQISGFNTEAYNDDGIKEIQALQEKYLKAVDVASTEKKVKKAVKDFKDAAAKVKTKAQVLEEAEAAKAAEETQNSSSDNSLSAAATKANALKYVGSDVSSLIAAIGNPISKSYAQSCLGPGQDGVLRYQGFTVYTYREGGKETVNSVE